MSEMIELHVPTILPSIQVHLLTPSGILRPWEDRDEASAHICSVLLGSEPPTSLNIVLQVSGITPLVQSMEIKVSGTT